MLVNILLVVGDDGLGDSLTDGVDLGSVTTTGDTDADVDTGELVLADDQEGLVDLDWIMLELIFRKVEVPPAFSIDLYFHFPPLAFWVLPLFLSFARLA